MSTHAIIKLEGYTVAKLYMHFDGYPKSTLPWLINFNEEFVKHRGIDNEYKFAQLIRSSAFDSETYDLNDSRYTGWGVVDYRSKTMSSYQYLLKEDGTVEYSQVGLLTK